MYFDSSSSISSSSSSSSSRSGSSGSSDISGIGNSNTLLRLLCCKGDDCKAVHGDVDGGHLDQVR